jgi:hypothetical protein
MEVSPPPGKRAVFQAFGQDQDHGSPAKSPSPAERPSTAHMSADKLKKAIGLWWRDGREGAMRLQLPGLWFPGPEDKRPGTPV